MPLPFGTPCYFGNVRGNLIYCSVLSSGWQESPQGNTKMGIRGEGLGLMDHCEKEPCPLYILLDEFVKQIHDVSLKTSHGMASFLNALISEWLLSSHEIPWNQLLHLWPLNAMRNVYVTTKRWNEKLLIKAWYEKTKFHICHYESSLVSPNICCPKAKLHDWCNVNHVFPKEQLIQTIHL